MDTFEITLSPEMRALLKAAIGKSRPLSVIAREIRTDWLKPNYAAIPYINAMRVISDIDDKYGYDDARSIVRYFLSNASSWRGDKAKAIKAELKAML